jgi:hypothetical protein
MRVMYSRADSIDALSQAPTLSTFFGPVSRVDRTPLETIGFTGAIHERWRVLLDSGEIVCTVAKRVRPSKDWISCRTGDMQGREACFLGEPALNAVWDLFECPYIAFATAADDALLLMHDLSPHLVPMRELIARAQEDRLVSALAALHARFWESPHALTGNVPTQAHVPTTRGDTGVHVGQFAVISQPPGSSRPRRNATWAKCAGMLVASPKLDVTKTHRTAATSGFVCKASLRANERRFRAQLPYRSTWSISRTPVVPTIALFTE